VMPVTKFTVDSSQSETHRQCRYLGFQTENGGRKSVDSLFLSAYALRRRACERFGCPRASYQRPDTGQCFWRLDPGIWCLFSAIPDTIPSMGT
jgi:hypothetical protein